MLKTKQTANLRQVLLSGLAIVVFTASAAVGQNSGFVRPTAPKLFPDNTLAYFRIDDTRELKAKLAESASGKMAADPQIGPLVTDFYNTFNSSFTDVQDELGIEFSEILAIPNGELALGLIPGEGEPMILAIIEANDELPVLELIVAKAEEGIERRDGFSTKKKIGPVEIIQWESESRPDRQLGYFIDSGCLVVCSNAKAIERYAKIWTGNGVDHKSLADNRRFTSILSRCVGLEGERPQLSFFADPFAFVKEVNKDNIAVLATLPLLSSLGIDGIQGVGGSLIVAPNGFDSIFHLHLLLDNPRRGLLKVIGPKNGDTKPPSWVAEDVALYFVMNWKTAATLSAVKELFETLKGPDSFEQDFAKPASRGLGIDIEKDFFNACDDRVCFVRVLERPASIDGMRQIFSFKLKQPQFFESTTMVKAYDHLKAKDPRWEKTSFGQITIYCRATTVDKNGRLRPSPHLAVLGDELIVADSRKIMEAAIEAFQNGEVPLSESLEYKIVQEQIRKQLGSEDSSIVLYQRPEETLRMFYDVTANAKRDGRLQRGRESDNPFLKSLAKTLDSRELPPFETLRKYLSPMGAYVTDEENGLHYTGFTMKR